MVADGPYTFEVEPLFAFSETPTEWIVTATQPELKENVTDTALSVSQPPVSYEDKGSAIVCPVQFSASDTETATIRHEGDGAVSVHIYPQSGDFGEGLFTDSGTFEAETSIRTDGVGWITVLAPGAWTRAVESVNG